MMDHEQFDIAEFGGAPRRTGWVGAGRADASSQPARGPAGGEYGTGAPQDAMMFAADTPRPARASDLSADLAGMRSVDAKKLPTFMRRFGGNPHASYTRVSPNQTSRDEHGVWWLQDETHYDLLDEMDDRDGTISASLDILVAQVLSREFSIESSGGGSRGERIARITREMLIEVMSDWGFDYLREALLRNAMTHGVSVCEIIWGKKGEYLTPIRFAHRHPGQFDWTDAGDLSIIRPGQSDSIVAPINKFVVMRRPGRYSNPWGDSLIFPLRFFYWFKREAILAWAEAVEVYGNPILTGTCDREKLGGDIDRVMDRLEEKFKDLRTRSALIIPAGVALDSFERKATDLPHRSLVRDLSHVMAQVILGASLTTQEAEFGTRAQSETQAGTIDHKVTGLVRLLRAAIQNGLIAPFVRLNFGDKAPMPKLWIDEHVGDSTDPKNYLEMVKIAQEVGVAVSEQQVRDITGLQKPIGGDDVLIAVSPQSVSVAPSQSGGMGDGESEDGESGGNDGPGDGGGGGSQAATAEIPEEVEDDADIEMNQSRDSFAESSSHRGARVARDLFSVATGTKADSIDPLVRVIADWSRSVDREADAASIDFSSIHVPEETFDTIVRVSRLLAMRDFDSADVRFVESLRAVRFAEGQEAEDIASLFDAAADWLSGREVMTVEEAKRLAGLYASIQSASAADIERAMRSEVLALAGATDDTMTAIMRDSLLSRLENGGTVADWFADIDAAVNAGNLPGMTDAYLDNVYRTETGNYYLRNQDDILAMEGVRDLTWGFEFYNPGDDNSDPTHAAVSGVRVKHGSAAAQASVGGPPWRYMCRCVRMILVGEYEETAGAEGIMSAISRFCDCEPRDLFATPAPS